MQITSTDHVSIPVRDLPKALAFYRDVLGLRQVERPNFGNVGAWLSSGSLEIHLTVSPHVHFRPAASIDTAAMHFAGRVADFDATRLHLERLGYSEGLPDGDPKRLVLRLDGPAPYRQLYLLDPENHVIEINDARLKPS